MAFRETYVNAGSFIAISVIFIVLSILAVSGRIYSHRLKRNCFGIDDYLCFAGAFLLIACSADLIVGVSLKTVGYHSTPSYPSFGNPLISEIEKVQWAYNQMWMTAAALIKLSWLCLYRRIFRGKVFSIVNYTTMALVIGWGISSFLVNLFECGTHFDKNWAEAPVFLQPQCINSIYFLLANAVVSCFLDLTILLIPMPVIWRLNMPLNSRIALIGLFAVGLFCVAASALRVATHARICLAFNTLNHELSIMGLRGDDDFGVVSMSLFWSQIELGVATVASCLPFAKSIATDAPMFSKLRSTLSGSSFGKGSGSGNSSGSKSARSGDETPQEKLDLVSANVASVNHDGPAKSMEREWQQRA